MLSYIVRKNMEVLRFRLKLSEFVDLFTDNLYKVLPPRLVAPMHQLLTDIIDEIIWL